MNTLEMLDDGQIVNNTITMSKTIGQLALALSKTQMLLESAQLDSTNSFLKNKYASLNSVFNACRKALSDNKIALTQIPTTIDGKTALTTILLHESNEWIAGTITIPTSGQSKGVTAVQVLGSTISYLRRYMLSAMVGISTGDDLDGEEERKVSKVKTIIKTKVVPIVIPKWIPDIDKYVESLTFLFDLGEKCNIKSIYDQVLELNVGYDGKDEMSLVSDYPFPDKFIVAANSVIGRDENKVEVFNWILEKLLNE